MFLRGSMSTVADRVALRYAREFSSPEALKTYLQEHPKADKSKHTVGKPKEKEEKGKEEGGEDEGKEEPKKGLLGKLKGKLKSMSDGAKKVLTEAPKAVQAFFTDEKARKDALMKAHTALTEAPGKYAKSLVKTVKHEVHEFKDAGKGIAKVMKGDKMSDKEKHALKTVAKHMAIMAGAAAFSVSGVGAGAAFIGKAMGKHMALKAAAETLGDIHTLGEVGIIGKGLVSIMSKLAAEEGKDIDPEEALAALVMAKVMKQMKELTDEDMAAILEEASKGGDEGSKKEAMAEAVAFRYLAS